MANRGAGVACAGNPGKNILWATSDFCQKENTKPINWQAAAAVSGGGGEPIQDAFPISVYVSSHIICGHTTWGKNKIKTLTLNSLMLTRPRTCRIAEPGFILYTLHRCTTRTTCT